jgi:CheY-like chemotaxis protein
MGGAQERKPIRLSPVVREAVNFLRASIPATIEIRQHIADKEAIILADPTQVQQIIANLCANAAQAMEDAGGVVEISVTSLNIDYDSSSHLQELQPGHYVRLSVLDTGHGMDQATLQRIFDPYFTTKEQGKGTGLGLAVVHGIVQAHDGRIDVSSELGKGTVFHVFFPRIQDGVAPEQPDISPLPRGKGKILLIDDEPSLVHVGEAMLESLGYEVTGTTNSMEALALFRENPDLFDAVITDYTMPKMTGVDLAAEILRIRADVAILLCTGYTEKISPERARELGVCELLIKPVNLREMANAVHRALKPVSSEGKAGE